MTAMILGCFDCGRPIRLTDPLTSNSGRDGIAAARIYRKYGGCGKVDRFADRRKKGPKPLRLVFVGQHQGEDRCGCVAGADVQFQAVFLPGDDDVEASLLGVACVLRVSDGELCHRRNIVADTGYVLAGFLKGFLDDRPYGGCASEGIFPVLADRVGLAEVHEDPVLDGLGAGVGVDGFTERIFTGHGFVPFGQWGVCHGS